MGQFCQHTNPQKNALSVLACSSFPDFAAACGVFVSQPPRSRKIRQSPSQGCHFNRSAGNANGLFTTTETATLFIFGKRHSVALHLICYRPQPARFSSNQSVGSPS